MTEDEIAVMDGGKCILQLRGVRPFFSEKYNITKHPKYKYLYDCRTAAQVLFHVKGIFLVKVGKVLVLRVFGNIVFFVENDP